MDLKAYGKINLSIDVLGKRDDGYHDVKMIMQSIGLYDILKFESRKEGIKIGCSNPYLPCDGRNIVYRTLEFLKSKYDIPYGMEVHIDKRIPIAAGLAGGSSDGSAAIIAADSIWGLKLSYEDMVETARQIGADVAFCIKGGTTLAEGIGEILTPLPPLGDFYVVLAKPNVRVSTKEVYSSLRLDGISRRPDMVSLIEALHKGNQRYVIKNMVNVLETVTAARYPIIEKIKGLMLQYGALGSLMSGSGPTVFGIFENHEDALKCCGRLRGYTRDVFVVKTQRERDVKF